MSARCKRMDTMGLQTIHMRLLAPAAAHDQTSTAGGKPQVEPRPFPEQFRPSLTATSNDDGLVHKGAKCRVSWWTGGPDYADEGGTQMFLQNPNCRASPPGIPERSHGTQSVTYGFRCMSDGRCPIFPSEGGASGQRCGVARRWRCSRGAVGMSPPSRRGKTQTQALEGAGDVMRHV